MSITFSCVSSFREAFTCSKKNRKIFFSLFYSREDALLPFARLGFLGTKNALERTACERDENRKNFSSVQFCIKAFSVKIHFKIS